MRPAPPARDVWMSEWSLLYTCHVLCVRSALESGATDVRPAPPARDV